MCDIAIPVWSLFSLQGGGPVVFSFKQGLVTSSNRDVLLPLLREQGSVANPTWNPLHLSAVLAPQSEQCVTVYELGCCVLACTPVIRVAFRVLVGGANHVMGLVGSSWGEQTAGRKGAGPAVFMKRVRWR